MSLNASSTAKKIADNHSEYMHNFKDGGDILGFLKILSKSLDEGFQEASISLENVDISPPFGSLNIPDGIYEQLAINIGLSCAGYWSKAIAPGTPQSCSSITSVTNDAGKIAAPIAAGIMSLCGSSEEITPHYEKFVKIIFDQVKTISWVITESSGNCSATFGATVS